MAHGSHQLAFPARPTWGGRRAGAGRKPAPGRRPGVAHATDHLHLIVEADVRATLARGVRGLAIRVARAVNRALDRRGAVCVEPPQALRGRTRPGPVLVGAVVHWLAECAGDAARAATRRRRAHMAGRRRLASPWSHRWCNRVPKNQTPMPEGTPRPPVSGQ